MLEVHYQGVNRALLSPKPLGEDLSLHLPAPGSPRPSLTCGSTPLMSAFLLTCLSSLCLCVPLLMCACVCVTHFL